MAFFRVKSIKLSNGNFKSYLYYVRSCWNKEKQQSRQKVISYIGKVENLEPFNVKKVFERDGAICKKCDRQDTLTIDHIIPLSKGGSNHLDNLQVLCEKCNRIKRNLLPKGLDTFNQCFEFEKVII